MSKSKQDKIVAARLRLRERFKARMEATPSLADPDAQGSGELNRHGMPKLPVGQTETHKWPVLDLGITPEVSLEEWRLELRGSCDAPQVLDWPALMELEQIDDTSDFHCVTTWSQMDIQWRGVRFSDLAALAEVRDSATHVMCHGYDGYTTNVSLAEALKEDVLLVYQANGAPLSREHGGPVRMITPQLYAWKGAKWIKAIEFMDEDRPGFWEQNGYSMTGNPWRDDRYS